jgi:3-phenylpropionate/trans-cinnamate dioxygenase ferredoxin reductase subunit
MSIPHVKYLLIGGGLASSSAAEAIRQVDEAGSVLLIGQEISGPYHRPPLSKEYLRRQKPRAELFVSPPNWFEQQHITLRTGRRCAHLDVARMSATLDSGEEISFDQALLATGGSPARLEIPGADMPNVFYLRTLQDAERLQMAIDKAKAEGRAHERGRGQAVVVGGGLLGVEIAASLSACGLAVTLLLATKFPWEKFAGENTGSVLARYLTRHNITVLPQSPPQRIEGDGRVQRVVADGNVVIADFIVAAVGMSINRELLRGTPITSERAILTDEFCQTNVPHIWAAGDCAALLDPLFGKHRIIDHWDHARVSGTLAGRNMAGRREPYNVVNNFFSDVFDLSLNGWGEARQVERRLLRGSANPDSPDFVEIGIAADGRIAQVLAINHSGEDETLRSLVAQRTPINGNEELLKDPATNLADLLR